jgi:hypothetical protein
LLAALFCGSLLTRHNPCRGLHLKLAWNEISAHSAADVLLSVFGQVSACPRSLHPDRDELHIVYEECALQRRDSESVLLAEHRACSSNSYLPEKGDAPKYESEVVKIARRS